MRKMTGKFTRGTNKLFKRFRVATAGAIAIEFALIFPVMVTIYFGVVEMSQGLAASRKVTMVTSTVGDLVAQFSSVGPTAMSGVYAASAEIMRPYDTGGSGQLKINVYSISTDPADDWSHTNGNGSCSGGTPTVPANLLASGGSVIVSRVCYVHNSVLHRFFTSDPTFTDTFFLRPRQTDLITWDATL